jgi:putative aldouronate transport system permease protein
MSTRTIRSGDVVFDTVNHTILIIVLLVVLFPLWFLVIASFSNPDAINRGEVILWVKDFDLIGYEKVFKDGAIWMGYLNTIIYAFFGVWMALFLTLPFAYAISRPEFFLRKFLTIAMLITWYFHGGLIPTFLVVKKLGLYDTRLIIIILGSFGVWNVVIARTFFRNTIPGELWEASRIDGCNHLQYFTRVVIPLSKAVIVVLMLFSAVAQWNDFFKGLMYLSDAKKRPLQLVLRSILIQSSMESVESLEDMEAMDEKQRLAGVIRYCVVIIGAMPLLIVYPFFQRYFIQGVMIGSVKG